MDIPGTVELGLDTFGDVTIDDEGRSVSQAQALRDVVAEAVLADQVGVDAFGVGEHHRRDFSVSAPEVVLAAIAGKTNRIVLGSAVTVLSTDDPVRVFQRFSTLNAVSNGRAEVILGRGSFTESYPLFGYDLARYEELFEDKLRLSRGVDQTGARHVDRKLATAAHRPGRVSDDGDRPAADVGRCGRQPGLGRAGRTLRPAADARDHRRQPGALQTVRRPVPRSRSRASANPRSRSRRTRLATSPPPTIRREATSGRTISG